MKFESQARIALPIGLLPNTTIKARREHLLQWEARVALFNGIIDDVRIYNRALSLAESRPI
jgi:hypothetical protein